MLAAIVDGLGWIAAQLGFYLCLLLPAFAKAYEFFSLLAFWPVAISTLFFPEGLPGSMSWPVLNLIALVGWLLVAVVIAAAYHFLSKCVNDRIAHGERAR